MGSMVDSIIRPTLTREVMTLKKLKPYMRNWTIQFPEGTSEAVGGGSIKDFTENFMENSKTKKYNPKGGMYFKGNIYGEDGSENGKEAKTEEFLLIQRENWDPKKDSEILEEYKHYEVSYLEEMTLCSATTVSGEKIYFFLSEMSAITGIAISYYYHPKTRWGNFFE